MKSIISVLLFAAVAALLILVSGCGARTAADSDASPTIEPSGGTMVPVKRFGPDQYGVACYSRSTESVYCVQVHGGQQ